jgi:MFS family permease
MMGRIFAVLLIATACGGIIFNSTTISMPKVFDERLQALTQSNFGIGLLVAVVYSIAALAQLVMGALIDRTELKRLMIGVALMQIPLLFLAANLEGWPMLFAALAMMLAVFGQIPLNDAIVGRYCADEYRARARGPLCAFARRGLGRGAAGRGLHHSPGGFTSVFFVLAALASGCCSRHCSFRRAEARRAARHSRRCG